MAIDALQQQFPETVYYFPAYELCLDELRDYRFYAQDMLHPSDVAVEYIWEAFCETFFGRETRRTLALVEEVRRALAHKPFHPEGEAYRGFIEGTLKRIMDCTADNPTMDFTKEIAQCRTILAR